MGYRWWISALPALTWVLMAAGGVWAGPFEQGITLFEKGQYNTAARQSKVLQPENP